MFAFIVRRILWAIPVLFCIVLVTFVLSRSIPGGPFDRVGDKSLPPTVRANLEAKYGLDKALPEQVCSQLMLAVSAWTASCLKGSAIRGARIRGPGKTVVPIVDQVIRST